MAEPIRLLPMPVAVFRESARESGRLDCESQSPTWARAASALPPGLVERVLADGESRSEEGSLAACERDDEGARTYVFAAAPLPPDEGRTRGVLVTASDVTAARADAARLQELLLAMVGHDLRNPLSAVFTGAALLQRRGGLTPQQEVAVQRISTSAERMARMIDQILEFTRAALAKRIPVEREPLDLAMVTRAVLAEVIAARPTPPATVEIEVSGSAAGAWDPALLEHMVASVLRNAIQHGDAATTVRIAIRDRGPDVELVVENGGEPIPRELLPILFDPYALRKRAKKSGSLGLGLHLAERIAVAHGGTIEVTSSREAGTRVRIVLPRGHASNGEGTERM